MQSCVKFEYVQHEMSQVVNTAWAVLALLKARCEDRQAIERGVRLIMSRQLPDGNWKQVRPPHFSYTHDSRH